MKLLRNCHRPPSLAGLLVVLCLVLSGCGQSPTATPPPLAASGDALFAQANAFGAEGKFVEAEAAYRQAIALDPSKPSYWQNLAVTLYQLQRLPEAEQSLKSGLELAPDDAQLNYLLGIVFLQQARLDDASVYLLKATELDPKLPEPYYGLGALYKQQGKRDQAIQAFERFLELGPGQDEAAVPNAQAELETLRAGQ